MKSKKLIFVNLLLHYSIFYYRIDYKKTFLNTYIQALPTEKFYM